MNHESHKNGHRKQNSVLPLEVMSDDDDKNIEAMQKEVENILCTITSEKQDLVNANHEDSLRTSIKVKECNEPQASQPNNASKFKACNLKKDFDLYGTLNIKYEDYDVEEYIKNNKEIDEIEIWGNRVNPIETKEGNKDIEKVRPTDKLNDNTIYIKVNYKVKESDQGSLHGLEKENIKNNSNVNDNNLNEIDVKEEIIDEHNEDNIIMPQENSPTNITDDPDAINNSDVEKVRNAYYEYDYEMVLDDISEKNGTDKGDMVMMDNKTNYSNWQKYAPETAVLREFIAMLQGIPYTNLETVSQKPYLRWCKLCSMAFDRSNNCKRHFIEHLLCDAYVNVVANKGLKCQICGEVFSKNSTYKIHMRRHASLPVYKCELCNKSFSDSSNFTKHQMVHKKSIHTCDFCQKKFKQKHHLVKHLEKHETSKSIVCNVEDCNRVFYSQSVYIRHCRQVHLKQDMQYTCIICKERFMSLKEKWDHQRTNHIAEKSIACGVGSKVRLMNDAGEGTIKEVALGENTVDCSRERY